MGIRTALGYQNSTPNILLAESKVLSIWDRIDFLAKNIIMKIIKYGENDIRIVLANLVKQEDMYKLKCLWK